MAIIYDWNEPRDWQPRESLTSDKLNQEIGGNLKHLFRRPRQIIKHEDVGGSDITTTSTTFVAIDDTIFYATLETFGGDVQVEMSSHVRQTAVGWVNFDVYVDSSYYLSSLTADPLSNGITGAHWLADPTEVRPIRLVAMLENLAAGEHTFSLQWRVSTSTGYLKIANFPVYFIVREV